MKYIVIIPDGAADDPRPELDGRTPLEAARTPALDRMTGEGRLGLAATVPEGMHPGSDVANMSLLGYNPKTDGYTGRAALEAASLEIAVPDGDAVFRANMVTVEDGVMIDYSAGHITTEESGRIIADLGRDLNIDGVTLYPGVGYRHICRIEGAAVQIPECTPPHEIMGDPIAEHAPQGGFSSWVLEVERTSAEIMPGLAVNLERAAAGKNPATQLWLWGGATAMTLEPFPERFGLGSAGLISAVDLLRGLAKLAKMDTIDVPGITAYYDTNYAGKGRAALDYVYDHDFVAVHVEAPDEAGHNGDLKEKIRAIENIDERIIAPIYVMAKHYGDWRILVAPDHPTPVATRAHNSNPVPYLMWGPGMDPNGATGFSEREAERAGGDALAASGLLRIMTGTLGGGS
ncbi:MAG: cofactor-independent phosphoglycerate mutase [Planctomycetota bacterium]|jgi:2,3-bisphosphoglycerate-independent phosphoglycerate mutase|nr:cofactor-independent phosphoglycerate mutase [Planctomycetota bacterium]